MEVLKVETGSFSTTVENQQNRKHFRFSIIMQIDYRNERTIEMKSNKL
jgi:CRISPR/Cas system endoribonuclease Cas6 (RAMP superfamily)